VRERDAEALNDHLARLLAQGDELMAEWKRYGEGLRAVIDGQIAGLDRELGAAVEKAARAVAPRAAAELTRELQGLGAELQKLREATRRATGELGFGPSWRRHVPMLALLLALLANGLLVATVLRAPQPVPLMISPDR
jgi:hypothetical protein